MRLDQMRLRADKVIPVIENMKEPLFDMRNPPSERNKRIAISVLKGERLSDQGVSRERARQIVHHLYDRAERILRDEIGVPLSTRVRNCVSNQLNIRVDDLKKEHFLEVAQESDDYLLRIPNFGRRALQELRWFEAKLKEEGNE